MLLLFRPSLEESVTDLLYLLEVGGGLALVANAAVLLLIVSEPAISEVDDVQDLLVEDANQDCRATWRLHLLKGLIQDVKWLELWSSARADLAHCFLSLSLLRIIF